MCQNLYGGPGSGKCSTRNDMKINFKIVKTKPLNNGEMAINITCPVCYKVVNFEGSFERVRGRRDAFVNEHSCIKVEFCICRSGVYCCNALCATRPIDTELLQAVCSV